MSNVLFHCLDQYPTVPASTTGIHRVLDTTHGGLRFRVRKSRPFADRDRLQAEGVLSGSRKSTWYKRPFTLFDYGQLPDMSDSGVSLSLTSSASLASLVRQSAYGANHTGVQGGGQQGGAGNAVNGVGHGGNRGETAEGTGEMGLGTRETARGTGEMALGTGETVEGRADRVGKVGTDQDDGGCL